jgi:hypothetical protein
LLFVSAPLSSSQTYSVILTAPWLGFTNGGPVNAYDGAALSDTLCGALASPDAVAPGTGLDCLQLDSIEPFSYPAEVLVTVRGPTPAAVNAEARRAFGVIVPHLQLTGDPTQPIQTGRPAWATTAPLWCAVVGLFVMLLVPPLPLRRRRHPQPDDPHPSEEWPEVPQPAERYSVLA